MAGINVSVEAADFDDETFTGINLYAGKFQVRLGMDVTLMASREELTTFRDRITDALENAVDGYDPEVAERVRKRLEARLTEETSS